MERLFQILAVIFIGIAAFFLWQNNMDAVFVSAVLGCCCFFLNIRFQIKKRNKKREEELNNNSEI
jgi:predicted membrane protein